MALRVALPENINPDEDMCIKVFIPADPEYLTALRSMLTYLGKWYAWERDPLKRGKDAAKRWVRADLKTIAALQRGDFCDGETVPLTNSQIVKACGGVVVIEGEDDMAITKVWIDYDTSELVVESGQCCAERFPLAGLVQTAIVQEVPAQGDEGAPTVPDTLTYTAGAR